MKLTLTSEDKTITIETKWQNGDIGAWVDDLITPLLLAHGWQESQMNDFAEWLGNEEDTEEEDTEMKDEEDVEKYKKALEDIAKIDTADCGGRACTELARQALRSEDKGKTQDSEGGDKNE